MERLTARDPGGNAYLLECDGCVGNPYYCRCVHFDNVCEKLAGYEEQGEQAEKLLTESEAARAELGKRLAAAQKMNAELTGAQAVMVKEFEAKLEELAATKRELENAKRNAEILAGEILDTKVCQDKRTDYIRMKFGYSPQLSHEALEKAIWCIARRILEEDWRMREERGEEDRDCGSLEQYFISHGFHGVPKDEAEKIRLVTTVSERLSGLSAEGCQALAKVCRRFLERMDERNGR